MKDSRTGILKSTVRVDFDTFLTTLYVRIDDFCKAHLPPEWHPGVLAALTRSEMLTLAIASQWQCLGSERGFYRYARRHLRGACPNLPDRSPFNRWLRPQPAALAACNRYLVPLLDARQGRFEALDGTAVPTRAVKRRGWGWLPGWADMGWSNRLGWDEGLWVLVAVTPVGVITGLGQAAARTQDQALAETFLAVRRYPHARVPSVGAPALGPYVTDKGVDGAAGHAPWQQDAGAIVIWAPKRNSKQPWPRPWRRWLAGLRQGVETVNGSLHHPFRLNRERPHALAGFGARLAAKITLHNFCIGFNEQLSRPRLAFADLIDW